MRNTRMLQRLRGKLTGDLCKKIANVSTDHQLVEQSEQVEEQELKPSP